MTKLPKSLLRDVWWCFAHDVPLSRDAMLEDVCFFAAFMNARDPRQELLRRLPFSDVRLRYPVGVPPRRRWDEFDDEDESEEEAWRPVQEEVRVVAGALSVLTCVDLLWDLHLAVAAKLADLDGHFLDGLELESPGGGGEPPTYRVVLAA